MYLVFYYRLVFSEYYYCEFVIVVDGYFFNFFPVSYLNFKLLFVSICCWLFLVLLPCFVWLFVYLFLFCLLSAAKVWRSLVFFYFRLIYSFVIYNICVKSILFVWVYFVRVWFVLVCFFLFRIPSFVVQCLIFSVP